MTATSALSNVERERLTLDAVDTVHLVDQGEFTPEEAYELGGPDTVLGLVLYANYLEAIVHLTRQVDIDTIRQAARDTATSWRRSGGV